MLSTFVLCKGEKLYRDMIDSLLYLIASNLILCLVSTNVLAFNLT